MAAEFGRRDSADPYIVEQGGLFQEIKIYCYTIQITGDLKGLISHQLTVPLNDVEEIRVGKIFFQKGNGIHLFTSIDNAVIFIRTPFQVNQKSE